MEYKLNLLDARESRRAVERRLIISARAMADYAQTTTPELEDMRQSLEPSLRELREKIDSAKKD